MPGSSQYNKSWVTMRITELLIIWLTSSVVLVSADSNKELQIFQSETDCEACNPTEEDVIELNNCKDSKNETVRFQIRKTINFIVQVFYLLTSREGVKK